MAIDPSVFDDITRGILGSAIDVHRTLGPGLLESAYCECLRFELTARNIGYVWQRTVPIVYKGRTLDVRYQVDLVVESLVVVEVKSVAAVLPVHQGQTLTYMQLTDVPSAC